MSKPEDMTDDEKNATIISLRAYLKVAERERETTRILNTKLTRELKKRTAELTKIRKMASHLESVLRAEDEVVPDEYYTIQDMRRTLAETIRNLELDTSLV